MENLSNKTKQELINIRSEYVRKYIGAFKKPTNYYLNLKILDRTIKAKG